MMRVEWFSGDAVDRPNITLPTRKLSNGAIQIYGWVGKTDTESISRYLKNRNRRRYLNRKKTENLPKKTEKSVAVSVS